MGMRCGLLSVCALLAVFFLSAPAGAVEPAFSDCRGKANGGRAACLKWANPVHVERLKRTNSCPRCNLWGADLRGVRLFAADLRGADLTDSRLADADFRSANLEESHLGLAVAGGARLDDNDMRRAALLGGGLRFAVMKNSEPKNTGPEKRREGVPLGEGETGFSVEKINGLSSAAGSFAVGVQDQ